jgi:tetratricopeptide (TPR) repeat protein
LGNEKFRAADYTGALRFYKRAILETRTISNRMPAFNFIRCATESNSGSNESSKPSTSASTKKGSKGKSSSSQPTCNTGLSYKGPYLSLDEETAFRSLVTSIYCNISATYLRMSESEKALVYALRAVHTDPDSVKAILKLGQAYHALGDGMSAELVLTRALKLHSKQDMLGNAVREELRMVRNAMTHRVEFVAANNPQAPVQGTKQPVATSNNEPSS